MSNSVFKSDACAGRVALITGGGKSVSSESSLEFVGVVEWKGSPDRGCPSIQYRHCL